MSAGQQVLMSAFPATPVVGPRPVNAALDAACPAAWLPKCCISSALLALFTALQTCGLAVLQVSIQSLDDVVEYFSGIEQDLARPGEGGEAVFKPGWEVWSCAQVYSSVYSVPQCTRALSVQIVQLG